MAQMRVRTGEDAEVEVKFLSVVAVVIKWHEWQESVLATTTLQRWGVVIAQRVLDMIETDNPACK